MILLNLIFLKLLARDKSRRKGWPVTRHLKIPNSFLLKRYNQFCMIKLTQLKCM